MKRLIYLLASIAVVNLLSMNTVQADLVLHYKFDEGSGTITSTALGPNTATDITLNSSEYGTVGWGIGKYGNCVEMSGETYAYINATVGTPASWVDAVETGDPNSMTLAVWINITTSAKYTPSIAGAQDAFLLKLAGTTSSTRKPYFKITDSAGTSVEAAWDTEFAASEWTHLAGTFDGTTVKLYVNGTKVAEEPFSGFSGWKQDPPLAGIGKLWSSLRHALRGRYDEVRIYNEALGGIEISVLAGGVTPHGSVEVDNVNLEVSEGDPIGTVFSVHLSIPPESGEDVTVSLEDDSVPDVVTMTPSTLVFTEADYNIPQLVTVTVPDNGFPVSGDWDLPPDNAYSKTKLSLYVTSADPYYATPFSPILDVKVFDNECGAYGYNQKDLNKDCIVNFEDFALFAAKWMATL